MHEELNKCPWCGRVPLIEQHSKHGWVIVCGQSCKSGSQERFYSNVYDRCIKGWNIWSVFLDNVVKNSKKISRENMIVK